MTRPIALDPPGETVTLTVTPLNVDGFATRVRALASRGVGCISIQATFDQGWSDTALKAWERERRRIATWLIGAQGAGVPVPALVGQVDSPRPAPRPPTSRWAAAAVLAAAVTSAGTATSCGGEAATQPGPPPSSDAGDAASDQDYADGDATSECMGGPCLIQFDADPDQDLGDVQEEHAGGLCM